MNKFLTKSAAVFSAAIILFLLFIWLQPPEKTKKTNIIIFEADDLGQDATRLYNPDDSELVQMRRDLGNPFPENAPMPALEALAEHGVTFKNAWAMPVCSTTRAARSTGLYASTTGVGQVIGRFTPRFGAPGTRFDGVEFPPSILNPDDPNMLQRLAKNAGYNTFKFGKWHEVEITDIPVGVDPLDLSDPVAADLAMQGLDDVHRSGFDAFYGLLSGNFGGINGNGYGGGLVANSPGAKLNDGTTDAIHMIDTQSPRLINIGPAGVPDARNPTTEFADSAMVSQAIKRIKEAKDAGKPYFIEYSALAPHFQYEVPPGPWTQQPVDFAGEPGGWRTLNLDDHGEVIAQIMVAFNDLDDTTDPTAAMVIDTPGLYPNLYPLAGTRAPRGNSDDQIARRRAAFKALLSHMDVQLKRLLEYVDMSNTYVIFVGDNGTQGGGAAFDVIEPPNDPTKSKATVYRNGRLVPLVFAGPGKVKNIRRNDLVNLTDLYATVLDLIGVKQPKDTKKSSYSFADALKGRKSKRKVNVSELFPATATVGGSNPIGSGQAGPFGAGARAVGNDRFSLLAFNRIDENNSCVCLPDSTALPENDCLNEGTGVYEHEIKLEFYDIEADPFEENSLFLEELNSEQNEAFSQLCASLNKISRRATFYQNGQKVCNPNGDQLREPPPS